MNKFYASLLLTLTSVLSAQAQCPPGRYNSDMFPNVTITQDVVYGSGTSASGSGTENLVMDIYEPTGDVETMRPLIVFAHGGSFVGGDENTSDMIYYCTEFAKKGYVTASISYRLESAAVFISPQAPEKMVKEVVRAVHDGKAAVRYFRQDAATTNTYKINPNEIYFGGTSAGAILALHLAYFDSLDDVPSNWVTWLSDMGGLEGSSGNPGYSSAVKAVVSFAGAIADSAMIDAGDPPFIEFHALADGTVPNGEGYPMGLPNLPLIYGGQVMYQRAQSIGMPAEYYPFAGNSHPPFADGQQSTWDSIENRSEVFLYNIMCNASAIHENESAMLHIAPNPASLQFEVSSDVAEGKLLVTDLSGRACFEQNISALKSVVNTSHWMQGIYFVSLLNAEGHQMAVRKLIVE